MKSNDSCPFFLLEWNVFYIFALPLNPFAKCSKVFSSHFQPGYVSLFYIPRENWIFLKHNSDPLIFLHKNFKYIFFFFYWIKYDHSSLVIMITKLHKRTPSYLSTPIHDYYSFLYPPLHSRETKLLISYFGSFGLLSLLKLFTPPSYSPQIPPCQAKILGLHKK